MTILSAIQGYGLIVKHPDNNRVIEWDGANLEWVVTEHGIAGRNSFVELVRTPLQKKAVERLMEL